MHDLSKLKVSSSPHIRTAEGITHIMLDVIIALMPALIVSVYVFGLRALFLVAVSVASCVVFEYLYCKLLKKPNPIKDLSACVTGILLAFCLPVSAQWWMVVVGALFAIVIVKQLYGGIGKNFMNPALAGRAFLLASWPAAMTLWTAARADLPLIKAVPDAVSAATPLANLSQGIAPEASIADMALGMIGGSMGEVSALALLAGGIYLVYRKVITVRIPLTYIGTVAAITFLFPKGDLGHLDSMLFSLLSGGLMLGAIFMATDYTTSPITKRGQIIYGVGCGLLTVFIRYFSAYPEGTSYAILIMNALVFLIEKISMPKKFGAPPKQKKEAAK
ncbi:MAG: RnfABCDGE type electron transport complex subunit D [Clostridia bacterium]|nr:RnfABCDGE type electron transport complex subunit D [Clostridia bacterium]